MAGPGSTIWVVDSGLGAFCLTVWHPLPLPVVLPASVPTALRPSPLVSALSSPTAHCWLWGTCPALSSFRLCLPSPLYPHGWGPRGGGGQGAARGRDGSGAGPEQEVRA